MDRSKAYEILKSLNEKEYVTARDISESCETVSYTHLDVYKRQE